MSEPSLSLHEYRDLVDQLPIMIWRASPNTARDYFNASWLAFSGRTLDQEMGNGWTRGVDPEHLEACLEAYLGAIAQQRIFEMEYRLRRHDGCYRWVFDRGVPLHDARGALSGYLGSCIDVDDRVTARLTLQELRDAELSRLRGMLPMCAACKKIRDDAGYWQAVEVYVAQHADVDFSHALCPSCAARTLSGDDTPE
jgi:PAS domain S-box-containing protein